MREKFKRIALTKGLTCKVSLGDYAKLNKYKWFSAGGRCSGVYAKRRVRVSEQTGSQRGKDEHISMSRIIIDAQSGQAVDHINGDTLDNRRSNLRIATLGENQQGYRQDHCKGEVGYRGVRISYYWKHFGGRSKKYSGGVFQKGFPRFTVGGSNSLILTVIRRDTAALWLYGKGCWLNFPSRLLRRNFRRWFLGLSGEVELVYLRRENGVETKVKGVIDTLRHDDSCVTLKVDDPEHPWRLVNIDTILLVKQVDKIRVAVDENHSEIRGRNQSVRKWRC